MKFRRSLLAAPGVVLLLSGWYSCSDYKEIGELTMGDLHPVMAVPAIKDSLSIVEMAERRDENTQILFDDNGLAYAEFTASETVAVHDYEPNKNPIGEAISDPLDFSPSTPSFSLDLPIEFVGSIPLKKVSFSAGKVIYSVRAEYEDGTMAPEVKVGMKIAYDPTDPTKQWPVIVALDGSTVENEGLLTAMEDLNLMPDGTTPNRMRLTFSELSTTEGVASQRIHVTVQVRMEGVTLTKAICALTASTLDSEHKIVSVPQDLFKGTIAAVQELPLVSITTEITKPEWMEINFSISSLMGVYHTSENVAEHRVALENKAGVLPANTLKLGASQSNRAAKGVALSQFFLNSENSNIVSVFGKAPYRIEGEDISLKSSVSIEAGDILPLLGRHEAKITLRVRIPFYGSVRTNKMVSSLRIPVDALPRFDFLSQKPIDEKSPGSVELNFCFANRLPLNVYSELEFCNAAGDPLVKLEFKRAQASKVGGLPIFISAGGCDQTTERVVSSVSTHVKAYLTCEEYKKIQTEAKTLKQTYLFATPEQPKFVGVYKGDYVGLHVSVRFAADVSTNGF